MADKLSQRVLREGYDGTPGGEPKPIVSPILGELGEPINISAGILDLIRRFTGDELVLPGDMRNKASLHRIAGVLVEQFDPLANRVKIEVHKKRALRRGEFALASGALALFANVVTGGLAQFVIEGFFAAEGSANFFGAAANVDKIGDEERRIGNHWLHHLAKQIHKAAGLAHFADDKDAVEELALKAVDAIQERQRAFKQFMTERGEQGLKKAIEVGIDLDNAKRMGILNPFFLVKSKVIEGLEYKMITYHPGIGYASQQEIDEKAKAEARAASPEKPRWFGRR